MPFSKPQGSPSQIDQKLKTKRQLIIEEERIRVLKESLMLFYDKLIEKYQIIHPVSEVLAEEGLSLASREEIEDFASEYAKTKPIGY
tara:strand:- start:927 stop:1187 length:261 start_codon:yes stop_codon:yes gene_type:complete